MAFIKIYRGSTIKRVPDTVYESQYKNLGYRILKEDAQVHETDTEPEREPEIDSIPLSEMNTKQLKEFAARHDIDVSMASSAREARNIIRKAMQDR